MILTCASAAAQPAGPDPVRAHDIASLEGGLSPLETVPVASVPDISAAALAADARRTRGTGPLRVASVVRTNISAFRARGVVDESQVGDGDPQLTWRLRVAAPGATSIGVGFTRYQMPPGGRLFVFTPDYQEVLGPFTDAHNADDGQLWIPSLPGAEIVVEISVPADVLADLQVEIGAVERGFLNVVYSEPPPRVYYCQTDVVCSAANRYGDAVQSVAHIRVTGPLSTYICSGALINNTRRDRKPYFLTAYHCGGAGEEDRNTWWNQNKAASVRFFWRHHSDDCGQRLPKSQLRLQNWQSGARFVAGNLDNDFTLLELTRPVLASSTYRQHFAGWSRTPNRYQVVAGIHHPNGDAKSIAFDQYGPYGANVYPEWDAVSNEWDWNWTWCSSGANCDGLIIYWDQGGTEDRGSSGSPLFNGSQQIIGQLWGGAVSPVCGDERDFLGDNSNYSGYGWVKGSWDGGGTAGTRLRDWLDPDRTGAVSIDGIDAQLSQPNLVVRSPAISDSTLYAGQTFTLSATVHNEGVGTAPSTRLYWYHLPRGGSWARFSTSNSVTSLSPSQSSGERFTTTAPSLVGTHGYAACVATVAMESDTRDNCSSAVYVTVHARASSSPNLQVIRARVSDSTPTVGQQFRMYADVVNVGPAGSASTLLRYWRRPAGGGWDRLSSDTVGTISPGRYRGLSRLLMAPSRSGRYEYTACVNRVLGESNTDDNCFRPFLTVTVGDEGGQECTTNWGTLSTGRNVNGSWTGRCRSRHYSGVRYARYYSFTIRGRTSVTIDLTSPSVDTWLALYTGGGFGSTRIEADDDDGDGQNARITRTLEAGTYTIEATTWALMATGSFTLTVAPQTVAPQSCTNHLGTLSLSTVVRDGAWTGQCLSVHDTFGEAAGHYNARYYSFTLTRTAAVTLDLTSSTVGTWMALYHGSGTGSSRIVFNNDGGTGTNARIVVRELSAGTYTIEATTRWGGVTGSFRLTVTPRAADAVGQQAIVAGPPLEGTGGDPGTAKGEAMQLQPGTAKGEAMQLQPGTDQR